MNTLVKPLSYGVRAAIKDSPKTTYEIGKLSKVSPQNLYRFLDESGTRGLSQKSLDALGLRLGLTLVNLGRAEGLLGFHPLILDKTRKPLPEGTLLTDFLRHGFESSRKLVPEIAKVIDVSPTQFYRFLDKTRGLSLEKLDRLCGLLGLVIEGPPDAKATAAAFRMARKGAMFRNDRKKYIPPFSADAKSPNGLVSQPSPPSRPSSLYSPPNGNAEGDN